MTMQVGTSHFVDRAAAEAYYCGVRKTFTRGPYKGRTTVKGGMGYTETDLNLLISDGSIKIGKPTGLPAGAVLSVIPDEGRYQYTVPEKPAPNPSRVAVLKSYGFEFPSPVEAARARLDKANEAYNAAMSELCEAAKEYARQGTLEYAANHPRRRVLFCAAMGGMGLEVEHHGDTVYGDYDFDGGEPLGVIDRKFDQPEFVKHIADISDEHRFRFALGGDLRLECRGGKLHSDLSTWGIVKDEPYPGYKNYGR